MRRVLFVCVENSGRSQMAEAFAQKYGEGKIVALSAGTMPASEVNPLVVQVMKEKGVDISRNKPKKIDNKMVQESDKIVVMGCSAQGFCPAPLLGKVVDWKIEDPKGKSIEEVRKIRDEIEKKIVELVKES